MALSAVGKSESIHEYGLREDNPKESGRDETRVNALLETPRESGDPHIRLKCDVITEGSNFSSPWRKITTTMSFPMCLFRASYACASASRQSITQLHLPILDFGCHATPRQCAPTHLLLVVVLKGQIRRHVKHDLQVEVLGVHRPLPRAAPCAGFSANSMFAVFIPRIARQHTLPLTLR